LEEYKYKLEACEYELEECRKKLWGIEDKCRELEEKVHSCYNDAETVREILVNALEKYYRTHNIDVLIVAIKKAIRILERVRE